MSSSTSGLRQWSLASLYVIAAFILQQVHCLNSDGSLLLAFKYSVLADPLSALADWNYDDATPCTWNGVMCTGIQNESRVISFVLPNAQLVGSIPTDIGLIEHLRHLDLSGNSLNSTLPGTLFNASELRVLSLADNGISGEIPDVASNSSNALQVLNLSDNALNGGIPGELAVLPSLTVLSLANNYLSGEVPAGGFPQLAVLDLSSNLINGSLPRDLTGAEIRYLNVSSNKLAGDIPPDFGVKFPANATVDLSFNNLTGEIPDSDAFLQQKAEAFAGNPGLCGKPLKVLCPIPSTLSNPPPNSTSPPAFAAIPKNTDGYSGTAASRGGDQVQSGMKPAVIAAITAGDLAGLGLLFVLFLYVYQAKKKKQIKQLQQMEARGGGTGLKPLPRGLKEEPPSSSPVSKSGVIFPSCCRKIVAGADDSEETSETESEEAEGDEEAAPGKSSSQKKQQVARLVMVDGETELELETLLKASAYVLGASGARIVYKAVLADGTAFAVRRIGESCVIGKLRDFEAQVRSIAKFRHPNLLRLRGFYCGADEKLLIYDFAPSGSLANISISKKLGSSPYHLSWQARLKIAGGVARGLLYIHEKKSVHGNVKPSNVLLNNDMEPMLGDFGLEKLITDNGGSNKGSSARHFGSKRSTVSQSSLPDLSPVAAGASPSPSSSSNALSSQLSYQAPECLKNLKPTSKCDVYSFGVILLELIAGRLFSEAELLEWNSGFVVEERGRILRMADPTLRGDVQGKEEALLACFKLGFACACSTAQRRPSMKEAVQILDRIQSSSSSSANS